MAQGRGQWGSVANTVMTFGFYEMLGNSWVTAQLAASQKGLGSVKLVTVKLAVVQWICFLCSWFPAHKCESQAFWTYQDEHPRCYRDGRPLQMSAFTYENNEPIYMPVCFSFSKKFWYCPGSVLESVHSGISLEATHFAWRTTLHVKLADYARSLCLQDLRFSHRWLRRVSSPGTSAYSKAL
jgi:hypothetical protein